MKYAIVDVAGAVVAIHSNRPQAWPECDVIQVAEATPLELPLFDEFGRCMYLARPNQPLERLRQAQWSVSSYAKKSLQRRALDLWDALASRVDVIERWQVDAELRRLVLDRSDELAECRGKMDAVKSALRGV